MKEDGTMMLEKGDEVWVVSSARLLKGVVTRVWSDTRARVTAGGRDFDFHPKPERNYCGGGVNIISQPVHYSEKNSGGYSCFNKSDIAYLDYQAAKEDHDKRVLNNSRYPLSEWIKTCPLDMVAKVRDLKLQHEVENGKV